jgi:hypothetical protein
MYTISEQRLEGNKQFEGFSIDFTEELAKKLNFTYEIQLVKDGSYPGMIKEIQSRVSETLDRIK